MGGGDLNLKKSWHPSTLKNIERVWKAEQKHEAEKQKIEQLQRELAEERAKEEMRQYAEDQGVLKKKNERLDWMYQGPAGLVDKEQYLLGRKIDKTFEILQQQEEGDNKPDTTGQPGAIFDHGPVNTTVDLANKIREDPLFAIRKREVEQKKRLLDNPVKMKQLQQMLKQSIAKKDKKKKKSKKKHKKEPKQHSTSETDSNSEKEIAHKRISKTSQTNQLTDNGSHWQNGSQSSDFDSDERRKHSAQKDGHYKQPSVNYSSEYRERKRSDRHQRSSRDRGEKHKRQSPSGGRKQRDSNHHQNRSWSPAFQERSENRNCHVKSVRRGYDKEKMPPDRQASSFKRRLDEKEMERRRQEMIDNAKWREEQRQKNIQRYREEEERERQVEKGKSADFIKPMLSKATAEGSVQGRIKQKIYSIQRNKATMNENFAKR